MNSRERFHGVMHFDKGVRALKWEFGYWGATVDRWYQEGLPKKDYPRISNNVTTPTTSLYANCWSTYRKKGLPPGIGVTGGGLYSPTQCFPLDHDVRDTLQMDHGQVVVDVNLLFHPVFEPRIIEENDKFLDYVEIDGVTRRYQKKEGVIPMGMDWPIKDWTSWEQLKHDRLNLKDTRGRLPKRWDDLVKEYNRRDYPLVLGGYPHGYFGTLAHLMGYANLFYAYKDEPELIHDIQETLTELWLAVYAEVLADVEIDAVHIWEDISAGSGSMVAPKTMRDFMVPYYKRLTSFLKDRGVDIVLVDTDGDCFDIIPVFLEGGVTGLYPFEVSCGIDIVEVRRTFPHLQMLGGVPKGELSRGKYAIDKLLEPVEEVLKTGGYVPFVDHLVPPDVDWENFKYYRTRLNQIIDGFGD
ncbi:MAG: hypothetical protein KKE86_01020 [Planctomycetes bacterium]|nr:hypothetical protein [Planctomycetota bacterium]